MDLILEQAFGSVATVGPARTGRRRFGVPVGGPVDAASAELANAALGLAGTTPVYELGSALARFVATDAGTIAVFGPSCEVEIDGLVDRGPGRFPVRVGSTVVVRPSPDGRFVYVAHSDVEWTRVRFEPPTWSADVAFVQSEMDDPPEVVIVRSTHETSRVGVRLEPPGPAHAIERPSEPLTPGAIQWTPGGTFIVVGPDGPTIGGYPCVGVVVTGSLASIYQLPVGRDLSMKPVAFEEAVRLRSGHITYLQRARALLSTPGFR